MKKYNIILSKTFFLLSFAIGLSQLIAQETSFFVSDAGNWSNPPWKIIKYDVNGENPETFIEENLAWPQDILFLDDEGIVLISNLNSGAITKHDAETGAFLGNFATGIAGPTRMKIGADNLLYVLQWNGLGKIRRYNLDGNFIDFFSEVGVTQSIGMDWDEAGNLYVSSYNGDFVQKFDPQGNDLGVFIDKNLVGPTNVWFDANGDLLVTDYDGTAVKRFDSEGNYVSDFLLGLSQAEGVAYRSNGNILIGNGKTHSVKQFDSEGNYISDFIPDGSGGLKTPNALVIHTSVNNVKEETPLAFEILPTKGSHFLIQMDSNFSDTISCTIFNAAGIKVDSFNFHESINWDASAFSAGQYQIQIRYNEHTLTKKIMVTD